MTRFFASAVVFAACVLAFGCADNLPKATEIVHMRVLGVKAQVVGDETRATPEPGEKLKLSFDTVFPTQKGTNKNSQTLLISCSAPNRYTGGIPICQEFLDAAEAGGKGGNISGGLSMPNGQTQLRCSDLLIPKIMTGGVELQCLSGNPAPTLDVDPKISASRLLFLGVFCEKGTPLFDVADPLLFSCEHSDGGETVRLNGLIPIQYTKAEENHNPSLDDLTIVMDPYTKPWLAPVDMLPPDKDCRGSEQPQQSVPLTLPYADPGKHNLLLSYLASAREKQDGEPEDLELTIYTTGGEMERRFTLWSASDETFHGKLEADLDWRPPDIADLPTGGQLVRFFVTLRDQRGGFDFAERAACVY